MKSTPSSFCAAINCMDGRVQVPVINHLKKRFGVAYVDVISEPAPARILAEQESQALVASIRRRLDVSVEKHGARAVAVAGHDDCAGNPVDKARQVEHLRKAVAFLVSAYPALEVVALWADLAGNVEELRFDGNAGAPP